MTLFWKDQRPLLAFYAVQIILVSLLYWSVSDHVSWSIILYGVLLSLAVLAVYLIYRYIQYRKLYQSLDPDAVRTVSDMIQPLGEAPLPEAFHQLLLGYDRLRRDELQDYRDRMDRHIVFMNRWVHQMKTPLSVIQLTIQDMEDEPLSDSIQEELERLRRGLEMVIYTSRLEKIEDDFTVTRTILRQAVSESIAENRNLFIRKGIVPDLRVDSRTAVYTDAKWLRFMLAQLLVNAVNYSEGPGKKVTLSAYPLGSKTILEIRDQGIGIAKEDLKRVFHPYFTGERGRQYHESTGMGLYLVRETCERLGHDVRISSEPGEGTSLKLVFQTAPEASS
ncbi:sensor histidine kinase [Paenibacillus caui]|uniref:sensor histidine kinase n=1 Tax=Paenibacillus caui TaxID=2873927 RepID=UPI001CA88820|nr:sensor histidine kinase [Paenibacillus caui]